MPNPASVLSYGAIGLGFLLALLAYRLLLREQAQKEPRPPILRAVYYFEVFCIVLVILGALLQFSNSNSKAIAASMSEENNRLRAEIRNIVTEISTAFPDADKLSMSVATIVPLVTNHCPGGHSGIDGFHADEIRSISADASKRIASAQSTLANILANIPPDMRN
jgi:hypothetical protein